MTSTLDANKRHEFAMEQLTKLATSQMHFGQGEKLSFTRGMGRENNSGGHCFCMYCRPGEGRPRPAVPRTRPLGVVLDPCLHPRAPMQHSPPSRQTMVRCLFVTKETSCGCRKTLAGRRQAELQWVPLKTGDSLAQACWMAEAPPPPMSLIFRHTPSDKMSLLLSQDKSPI